MTPEAKGALLAKMKAGRDKKKAEREAKRAKKLEKKKGKKKEIEEVEDVMDEEIDEVEEEPTKVIKAKKKKIVEDDEEEEVIFSEETLLLAKNKLMSRMTWEPRNIFEEEIFQMGVFHTAKSNHINHEKH